MDAPPLGLETLNFLSPPPPSEMGGKGDNLIRSHVSKSIRCPQGTSVGSLLDPRAWHTKGGHDPNVAAEARGGQGLLKATKKSEQSRD